MISLILEDDNKKGKLYICDAHEYYQNPCIFDVGIDVRGIIEQDERGNVDPVLLDAVTVLIYKHLGEDKKVAVYCDAGVERSPLVVAWFLACYSVLEEVNTLLEAYRYIEMRRPEVQRRDVWIDWTERDSRGIL